MWNVGCLGFSVLIVMVLGMLCMFEYINRCLVICISGWEVVLGVVLLLCRMYRLICFGLMLVVFLRVW